MTNVGSVNREGMDMIENINYKQLHDLCVKYKEHGLTIDIEFNQFGILLAGYWDKPSISYAPFRYKKLIGDTKLSLLNYADMGELIDEFKEEFELKLKDSEGE